ncbi:hypothetical protein DIPPA_30794 [Diplonema papillatum]|nr:hypothetical protein DIPPA_30794 [Diplonema papillatum]
MPNACLRLMLQDQLADLQRMQVGRSTGFVQLARPHSAPLRRKGAAATAGHTAVAAAAAADPGDGGGPRAADDVLAGVFRARSRAIGAAGLGCRPPRLAQPAQAKLPSSAPAPPLLRRRLDASIKHVSFDRHCPFVHLGTNFAQNIKVC